jgi:hypothetical protein
MHIFRNVGLIVFFLGLATGPLAAEDDSSASAGLVTNDSDSEVYLVFVNSAGAESTQVAMPSATLTIPGGTVRIKAELVDPAFDDGDTGITINLPDNSVRTLRSLPGSVWLKESA